MLAENGDLKENKIFFCVDNSVFTWLLILWYEQKKEKIQRAGELLKNISADILSIVTQR
ncbi:hypothetical protein KZ774_17735 [Escherichia coli]|nr:hypothetical protein [Escherichia coli]